MLYDQLKLCKTLLRSFLKYNIIVT